MNETITQYLNDQLSPSEKIAFEKQLEDDADLRKEVEAQKHIMKWTSFKDDQASFLSIEKNLSTTKEQEVTPTKSISMWNYRYSLGATAAAILLLIGYFSFTQQDNIQGFESSMVASYSIEAKNLNTELGLAKSASNEFTVTIYSSNNKEVHYTLSSHKLTLYTASALEIKKEDIHIEVDETAETPVLLKLSGKQFLLPYTGETPQPINRAD
ncbi:hypothetical protein V6R21_13415 [Limibacter armeniacum]|uniref:hypothetical protein n=1 Tax=Limibacter armeniacum TaxID=466084 RepID=UPI002FE5B513